MKKRFREVIEDISYEDLLRIRKDIETGGKHIHELIGSKITQIEKEDIKVCATCGTTINPHFMDDFMLVFGRYDFKKKAYFCGLDCLNYFVDKLNKKEKDSVLRDNSAQKDQL
jgi:hypothetical protein